MTKGRAIHASATQFAAGAVKSAEFIIEGVSVITEGDALGHKFTIDATTLAQVKQCADAFSDGVRVKIEHGTGFESIVGVLKNFRIDGAQLRADLHLIKSHPQTETILEMAEKFPGSFGLSISFSGNPDENGAARCLDLYSVDLVDMPAANPNGLFSARAVDSKTKPEQMNVAEISAAVEKSNESLLSRLLASINGDAALKSSVAEMTAKLTTLENDLTAANLKVGTLTTERDAATASVTALTTERDELKAKLANPSVQIQAAAAHTAATITAAQGQPPVEIKPETANPASTKAKTELSGRARAVAAFTIAGQSAPLTETK
jgi:hypothetical protein